MATRTRQSASICIFAVARAAEFAFSVCLSFLVNKLRAISRVNAESSSVDKWPRRSADSLLMQRQHRVFDHIEKREINAMKLFH